MRRLRRFPDAGAHGLKTLRPDSVESTLCLALGALDAGSGSELALPGVVAVVELAVESASPHPPTVLDINARVIERQDPIDLHLDGAGVRKSTELRRQCFAAARAREEILKITGRTRQPSPANIAPT
jgi:hypothetical protein